MIAIVDSQTLKENILFGIGLLFYAVAAAILLVLALVGIKIFIRRCRTARAAAQERKLKYQPDGRPYPPFARGLCDNCQDGFDRVYYLPSGARLCPDCYKALQEET